MPRLFHARRARALLIATAAALGGCSAPSATLDAALFLPTLDGKIGLAAQAITDVDTIDLSSSLDLGGRETSGELRLDLDFGPLDLAASGFRLSQDGQGTVAADFGGITAGSTVNSKLDLALVHGELLYDVVDTQPLTLGVGLAADWIDLQLEEREAVFGLEESIDVQQPIPLLATRACVRIGAIDAVPLELDLRAAGISARFRDVNGAVADGEALVRAQWSHVGLFAGYRYVLLRLDGQLNGQSFKGDVTLSGWLGGISVRL